MKTLKILLATAILLPFGSALANDKAPSDPVEACKAKAQFQYHFEMMDIEKAEILDRITPSQAESQKFRRHMQLLGELKECEELKKD
jgi:hypothetical protein